MAQLVEQIIRMDKADIIAYQLLSYCFVKGLKVSNSELNCLTLLGGLGEVELSDFCNSAVEHDIFKSSQAVRNFVSKAQKNNLIDKIGTSRKKILLKPELRIQCQGSILLNYKIAYIEAQAPQNVH